MRRVTVLFAVVLVVVATVPVGAVAAGSQATSTQTDAPTETTATENATTETTTNTAETTATNESNSTSEDDSGGIAPGEQLAGVFAVQQAEIDGELESRSFGKRVSEAASNDSKARVVADQLNESRERLEELRERRSELRAARESGNISRGHYHARAAQLTAEIRSLQRLLDRSSDVARKLPAETRRSNGIDSADVERLRTGARTLSDEEVSDVARRVAGPGVGNGLAADEKPGERKGTERSETDAPGRSNERGPPSATGPDRGPNVGTAPGQIGDVNESIDEAPGNASERSNGTRRNDTASGQANGTDDGDAAPGNSGTNRGGPPTHSNASEASDADELLERASSKFGSDGREVNIYLVG